MQNEKVQGPSIRLSTVATSTRQTPKTDFGTVMRDGLLKAGDVAMQGLQVAAPFIPGSAIVTAAVAGANIASTVGGGGGASGFASGSHGLVTGGGAGPGAVSGNPGIGNAGVNGALTIPGRGPGLGSVMGGGGGGGATNNQVNPSAAQGDAFGQMMNATKSMAEFQASFNLQYLQLQEKLQQDTRQFNLVSNIMKTKHDAAKNALNNVR